MTDFQFDPGATNDPEENLHPYTMKPQTHGALDIHVLQISGQPMPAGAAMPVPKGPDPFTYTPKPVLHADEPQSLPDYPQSMKAKTATGGSVWYDYTHDKKPLAATVYDQSGQFESFHNPSEIAFPAFKTPVLDQLDAEITKLLGPEKSTLHVGEPKTYNAGYGDVITYKTPSGGFVDYHYTKGGAPVFASEYPTGDYSKPGISHQPETINFPEHPDFKLNSFYEQKSWEPTVHDTYSTAFAHYKNFDDDKPELEFAGALKTANPGMAQAKLSNGNNIQIYYHGGSPTGANEFDTNGHLIKSHSPEDVNLPQHPSEVYKPTLPVITQHELSSFHSLPVGEPYVVAHDQSDHNLIVNTYETDGSPIAFYYNKKGEPVKVGTWAKGYDEYSPEGFKVPPAVMPGAKPSLAKVNLPENYPKKEQIDELYNKPQEPVIAYPKFSPKEPLTESEQNLISDYTGTFYHEIANHIYGHYPNPKLEPKIEAINKAIAKHPLAEPVTLYRGLSYGNFQKFANLKPGQTATYDGFMSTSSNKHVGSKWKEGYHFVIETPVGTPALPVKYMSQHSSENEVLLSTKTKLKFIRREGNALHFEVVPRTE